MTKPESILVQLIRASIGDRPVDCNLPAVTAEEWKTVIDLAFEQGVDAISVDGYHKCLDEGVGDCLLETDESLEDLKFEWFGSVLQAEEDYRNQWAAATKLAKLFSDNGISTIVLKGFSISDCYPMPSHRNSCDFDCYLSDYKKAHNVMESVGVKVDEFYYKHSAFDYNGLHVENHQYLTSWRGLKKRKCFEILLQSILQEIPPEPIDSTSLLRPNPLFIALFLTKHAQTHFLEEDGITLRHLCDWGLFLKRYRGDFDWDRFYSICQEYGMDAFVDSMTRVAEFICFDGSVQLTDIDKSLLRNTLTIGSRAGKYTGRLRSNLHTLCSGWKFRMFSDETAFGCIFSELIGYMFVKNPKL